MKQPYSLSINRIALAVLLVQAMTMLRGQSVLTQTFFYTGTTQTMMIPQCASAMSIEARGAQGGSLTVNGTHLGGLGAIMRGVFTATPGVILNIMVGGRGNPDPSSAGGGGGSGVGTGTVPLIVAGGGGGADFQQQSYTGLGANTTSVGNPGQNSGGVGGSNGSDGGDWIYSSVNISRGGRGWNFNTAGSFGANGQSANTTTTQGTWGIGGGGGSVGSGYCNCGGGGGGYSGGGAGNINNSGGGGGSWNIGSNQNNTAATNSGSGLVIISYSFGATAVVAASSTMICAGQSVSLYGSGVSSYTWSSGPANNATVTVSPSSTTIYTLNGTNSSGCTSTNTVLINVASAPPTPTITASSNTVCLGKTVTLTASGGVTYTWSHGVPNGGSFIPSLTAPYTVTVTNGCGSVTASQIITVAPLPVLATASSTLVCAAKPTQLQAVSTATTYTWNPGGLPGASVNINPLSTTAYTVSASDGTCSGTGVITISVNPNPTVMIASTGQTFNVCAGSQVTLTASGANSYTWMNNGSNNATEMFNPSGPTAYTVVGENQFGCTTATTQVIVTVVSPTVNVTVASNFSTGTTNMLLCSGDAATLTASGNSNSYQWSTMQTGPSITVAPTNQTIFSVTGSAASTTCTTTKTIQIDVFTASVSVTGNTAICNGATTTLTASGADQYDWNNGMSQSPSYVTSPTVATSYSLTANTTSNGVTCFVSTTVQVIIHPDPTITISPSRSVICRGETTTLTAGGGVSYTWNNNATTPAINYSNSIAGVYPSTVIGTDANGCTQKTTVSIRVNQCTGIGENATEPAFSVYPVPSNGTLVIRSAENIKLQLVSQTGQLIREIILSSENENSTTVEGLPAGVYFLRTADNSYAAKIIMTQ